jgi:four helix bundle protein
MEAWEKARGLVQKIYEFSHAAKFRTDFGFKNQIRRAAVSIMSDIAERKTPSRKQKINNSKTLEP